MKKYFDGLSITTGVVRYKYLKYLLVTKDGVDTKENPHTRIYEIYGDRIGGLDLDWLVASCAVCHNPKEKFISIGQFGDVYVFGGGECLEEKPISPKAEAIFREVYEIPGGKAYAVGPARKVFKRNSANKWEDISAPMPKKEILLDAGFESIDGISESDIFAVGWGGEIWNYKQEKWLKIKSPTNLALYKVRCCSDGFVYACGQSGIILKGRDNQWQIIENKITDQDFWGMACFNNKVFLATLDNVYVLENDLLSSVNFGKIKKPTTCYHLSAADGIMWSIGAKDVLEYDGNKWSKIL